MQENPNNNPNQNFNSNNQPQTPASNPSNQTFINTTPGNNNPEISQNSKITSSTSEKIIQLIWFVAGFINVILILRIIFLLFNAQASGFIRFLYDFTNSFVLPFRGIFPAPAQANTYFDIASLVAIIIYSLVAWGIVTLVGIMSGNQNAE